jgi:hypothetical protein
MNVQSTRPVSTATPPSSKEVLAGQRADEATRIASESKKAAAEILQNSTDKNGPNTDKIAEGLSKLSETKPEVIVPARAEIMKTLSTVDQGNLLRAEEKVAYSNARKSIDIANSNGDAKSVNEAREKIAKLSSEQAQALFDDLIRNDPKALDKFAHEMVDSATFRGGISIDKQKDFFADIAGKLTGKQLAAVEQAFSKADGVTANLRSIEELSVAISKNASPAEKAEYIGQLAEHVTSQKIYAVANYGYSMDPEARSIGIILAGWKDPKDVSFTQAIQAVSPDGTATDVMNSVLRSSVGLRKFDTSPMMQQGLPNYLDAIISKISSLDSSPLYTSNVKDIKTGKNIEVSASSIKANTFASASQLLRASGYGFKNPISIEDEIQKSIACSIGKLIDSDPVGVMEKLSNIDGIAATAMSDYTDIMISIGEKGKDILVKQIALFMSGGPESQKSKIDSLDFMARGLIVEKGKDGQTFTKLSDQAIVRANALGYFLGGISAGFSKHVDNKKKEAEMIGALLNDVLGFGLGNVGKFGAPGAEFVTKLFVDSLSAGANPARAMADALFPKGPNGNLYDGPIMSAIEGKLVLQEAAPR